MPGMTLTETVLLFADAQTANAKSNNDFIYMYNHVIFVHHPNAVVIFASQMAGKYL